MESAEAIAGLAQAADKTILLVEDDLDFREVIAAALEEVLSCRILVAPSGSEAVKLVEWFTPDLLLLDYRLPEMDGIAVYERLHTMEGLKDVPALFLTAYPFTLGLKEQGHRLICLKKPVEFNELLRCIQELLANPLKP